MRNYNILAGLPGVFRYCAFLMLPSAGGKLIFRFESGVRDTAAGVWQKRWKHWGDWSALHLQAACRDMDSQFVWCREVEDYQKSLATLLAEMHCRSEVLSVVAVDLLVLPEVLSRLHLFPIGPISQANSFFRRVWGSARGCSRGSKMLSFLAF